MRLLVSGTTKTVGRLASLWPNHLGILLTPQNRNAVQSVLDTGLPWSVDNGAFRGFDLVSFRNLLRRVAGQPRLQWVACPDKVGDAKATLEMFQEWQGEIKAQGCPVALVGQDGLENLTVPWDSFECFFVGGTTQWKLGYAAQELIAQAKELGKLVHMGRVNTLQRIQLAHDLGCNSIDGSSFSRWGDWHIEWGLKFMRNLEGQSTLMERLP